MCNFDIDSAPAEMMLTQNMELWSLLVQGTSMTRTSEQCPKDGRIYFTSMWHKSVEP